MDEIEQARQLVEKAGLTLRDRYGYPASEESVRFVLAAIRQHPTEQEAVDAIGIGNMDGECELAMGADEPTDEDYERAIVQALRPLVDVPR